MSSCSQNGGCFFAFSVSVKRLQIKFQTTSRFKLKQLDYSLSISIRDKSLELIFSLLNRIECPADD